MRAFQLAVVCAAMVATAAQVSAGLITTVPTSLSPGDSYRLAFVTSTRRNGVSTNIGDYNSFVSDAANSVLGLAALGTTWKAIASAGAVEARDNTGTNPGGGIGVPIFLLNDTKLADSNADLWDGTIGFAFNVDESGASLSNQLVWTGTSPSGGYSARFFAVLGQFMPAVGFMQTTSAAWVDAGQSMELSSLPFYALSDVLTVPATSSPAVLVPEPGSWLLMTIGAVMLMGVGGFRRRKRASELTGPKPLRTDRGRATTDGGGGR